MLIFNKKHFENILKDILNERLFVCEEDLRTALACQLKKQGFDFICEYPQRINKKTIYEDIRLKDNNGFWIIELKYCPSKLSYSWYGLEIKTRDRSSSKRINDFNNDYIRTKETKNNNKNIVGGLCLFLTNENKFLNKISEYGKLQTLPYGLKALILEI